MVDPSRNPSGSRRGASVAVGVVVALALTLVVSLPELTRSVTTCELGNKVGSASIWTPSTLVNVPMAGSAAIGTDYLNWNFTSGSLTVGLASLDAGGGSIGPGKGEIGIYGIIGLANWTFYQAVNRSQAFGPGTPCTQPFVAQIADGLICGASGNLSSILVLANNASDAAQPHVVPPQPCSIGSATPGSSVWFDTSFHTTGASGASSTESLRLCGPLFNAPLNVTLAGPAAYPIVASTLVGGRAIDASGSMVWSGPGPFRVPTAEYSLAQGWVWNVSTIGAGMLPTVANPSTTSLLAFERSDC